MAAFNMSRGGDDACAFLVVGPDGVPVPAVAEFLTALTTRGRSAYTVRAYALGLAHWLTWLHEQQTLVDGVSRQTVEAYIRAFRLGPKGGACPVDPERAGQIHPLTRKPFPSLRRLPRTINHRLSVLGAFYAYQIGLANESGSGAWYQRSNPVPVSADGMAGQHGMIGRDAPRRGRAGELRQRVPRRVPLQLDPAMAEQLIAIAPSWRDKALLTLLYRTGQRIGDWSAFAGRHGVLGMTLTDVDERVGTVTVRLKGARDEHRVPVTVDFWPLWHRYLSTERSAGPACQAAWVGARRGHGKPLTYAAFESALRMYGRKLGVNVHAHLFRHTLAQAIVDVGQLKVAQELLGHAHISTTADIYARVDQRALVAAVHAVQAAFDARAVESRVGPASPSARYAFAYDALTLEELERAATVTASEPIPA